MPISTSMAEGWELGRHSLRNSLTWHNSLRYSVHYNLFNILFSFPPTLFSTLLLQYSLPQNVIEFPLKTCVLERFFRMNVGTWVFVSDPTEYRTAAYISLTQHCGGFKASFMPQLGRCSLVCVSWNERHDPQRGDSAVIRLVMLKVSSRPWASRAMGVCVWMCICVCVCISCFGAWVHVCVWCGTHTMEQYVRLLHELKYSWHIWHFHLSTVQYVLSWRVWLS